MSNPQVQYRSIQPIWLGAAAMLVLCLPAVGQTQTLTYSASAYGSQASVAGTVILGKTAVVNVAPCTTKVGAQQSNNTASVSSPPLLTTGVTTTNAATTANSATASSEVNSVNALSGLVTADDVKAVSTTFQTGGNLQTTSAGSQFVNLVVAGIPITSTPAPNTAINLPGIGRVVLNEQKTAMGPATASLTVNMIHISVTVTNILGIAPGTQIVIANAQSALNVAPGPAALDGFAFGTQVLGSLVTSGRTALVQMPCLGTNGVTNMNSVTAVNVAGVLTTGTVTDTAEGDINASLTHGTTTSTVQAANLLSSLVSADVITAVANASTTDGSSFNFDGNGSTFLHLAVAGHPEITDNVAENTKISLGGLGTLFLRRVIRTTNSIEVRMIELSITQTNVFGLPIGTDIRIGDAEVSLHSVTHP